MTKHIALKSLRVILAPMVGAILAICILGGCSAEEWIGVDSGEYDAIPCPSELREPGRQPVRRLEVDREERAAVLTLSDGSAIASSYSLRTRAQWAEGCPTNLYMHHMEVLDLDQEELVIGSTTLRHPVLVRDCPTDPVRVVLREDGEIGNGGGVSGTACSRTESCYCFARATDAPSLITQEYPTVAADIDGPGHLEYEDRLGQEVRERLQNLRESAVEGRLERTNASLAQSGFRLEPRADPKRGGTSYDLFRDGEDGPMLTGVLPMWPVSVNASGTDFVLAAENEPGASPRFLLLGASGYRQWDAGASSGLPPVYVGDSLARVTHTGFPSLTYQVELEDDIVYRETTVVHGAEMPLRSFTAWDGHWVLEVDDHLIVDGEDLIQTQSYSAAYGFALLEGRPFYFFEQDGLVHISNDGQTLANAYDEVFHGQCCEAAIHNIQFGDDAVAFHAQRDGIWYVVIITAA